MHILLIKSAIAERSEWGAASTIQDMCEALQSLGHDVRVAQIQSLDDLLAALDAGQVDLVWSAVYGTSGRLSSEDLAGDEIWVADILDEKGIAYVGSNAKTQQIMLDKRWTNQALREHGVAVPEQMIVHPGEAPEAFPFPAFVKPCFSSESMGMDENSVVHTQTALIERVRYIHETFEQPALIEEFLSGREYTATFIGEGMDARICPIANEIHPDAYERYAILNAAVKLNGGLSFSIPEDAQEIEDLVRRAGVALGCRDHVRIDLREDAQGQVKVMEVNGKPGLEPIQSRSFLIQVLYGKAQGEAVDFTTFMAEIIASATRRMETQQ